MEYAQAMMLDQIVADYILTRRPLARAEERSFKIFTSVAEAISHAVQPTGRKHPHQYRIARTALQEAEQRLQRAAPELTQAADFASLHDLVERKAGAVRGIGKLTVYDIAQRLGLHLGKAPDIVYLHRGARTGAAHLGFRGATLDPKHLPPAFARLSAPEIEDCLCIYKRAFIGGPLPAGIGHCLPRQRQSTSRC